MGPADNTVANKIGISGTTISEAKSLKKQTQEIPNDYMEDASVSDVPTPEIEWTTDYKYHIIRSRESLSDIATLYDKVSVDELMYWNELSPESSLKVGSVLVIKN